MADRLEKIETTQTGRREQFAQFELDLALALKEMRRHNKMVHGRFDWRVVGGVASGASVLIIAIAEGLLWLVRKGL